MVLLDNRNLLLAVGDHMYDGVESDEILPQEKTAAYGKTVLINLESRAASIYSLGHRNPQGLDLDVHGNIWETEHGPRGGDELNLIRKGKNYGWPRRYLRRRLHPSYLAIERQPGKTRGL